MSFYFVFSCLLWVDFLKKIVICVSLTSLQSVVFLVNWVLWHDAYFQGCLSSVSDFSAVSFMIRYCSVSFFFFFLYSRFPLRCQDIISSCYFSSVTVSFPHVCVCVCVCVLLVGCFSVAALFSRFSEFLISWLTGICDIGGLSLCLSSWWLGVSVLWVAGWRAMVRLIWTIIFASD